MGVAADKNLFCFSRDVLHVSPTLLSVAFPLSLISVCVYAYVCALARKRV